MADLDQRSTHVGQPTLWQTVWNKRMVQCLIMGFASGLPLFVLLNLLPAWLHREGVNLHDISILTLVQLPYAVKFLWAPLLDNFSLGRLGRRRSWMLMSQIFLLATIAALGYLSPEKNWALVVVLCLAIAFLSATQDIAIDAFRREILLDHELGLGNSLHINAYRLSGLVPGSLSLILGNSYSWPIVFTITALFMVSGIFLSLWSHEPAAQKPPIPVRQTWHTLAREPFMEFFTRAGARQSLLILAFILLYKLGDSLATALATPFYLQMGYALIDIGLVAKNAGLWCSILGAVVGGLGIARYGIDRALWVCGFLQALAILGFAYLAWAGPFAHIEHLQYLQLGVVVGLEAFGVGLGTAALVAFIARTTSPYYAATQFALFTSLSAIPRAIINSSAGWLVEYFGWVQFFLLCFVLALPGLLLLYKVAPWGEPLFRKNNVPLHP